MSAENPNYLPPKFDSNDWLEPIRAATMPVFARFTRGEAIEIASSVLNGVDSGEDIIPWTTVFPSDDLDEVLARLDVTLRTPDGETPSHQPRYRDATKQLRKILFDAGVSHFPFSAHAAYSMVQMAAGKQENFVTYQDLARRWPQYVDEWKKDLKDQFGEKPIYEAAQRRIGLFSLLGQNKAIATAHQQRNRLQHPGEGTPDFLNRTFEFISNVGSIQDATRLLEQGLKNYKSASYQLRGLSV